MTRCNGIDVDRCTPSVPRESVRAAWGFGGKHRLIGYVGRYSPEKNPAAAARAARELGREHRAVYLGQGPMEARLRAAAGADPARVRFLPAERQVGNVLGALDAFVLQKGLEAPA
jgi:glycosyltransferase involved in cell wall biosynthesis